MMADGTLPYFRELPKVLLFPIRIAEFGIRTSSADYADYAEGIRNRIGEISRRRVSPRNPE
jgi:hypothetical protein